ncbi:MAG: DUF748 domain-containing protein [Pseudomonadota bacterium]
MIAAIKRFLPVRLLIVAAVLALLYLLMGFQILPALGERYLPRYAAEQLQRKASVGEIRVNPILFTIEIRDFRLAEQDDAHIIGFKRLLVDFELSSLFRWAWTFANITLDGLDVRAEIRPDGRLNLLDLLDLLRKPDAEDKAGPPPRMLLQHAILGNGMFALSDRSGLTPAQAVIGPVNLELQDISTLPKHRGPYALNARLPAGGAFSWRGEASLRPIFSRGEVSLKGLKLATLWNFLRDEVNLAEPAGDLDFSLNYQFDYADSASRLSMEKIALKVAGLALSEAGSKAPLLALEAVEAADGRFDLATRELVLPLIEIRKGSLAAQADNGGVVNWQRLVKATPAPAAVPAAPAATGAGVAAERTPASPPLSAAWRVKLDAVKIEDVALRYDDHSRAAPLAFSAGALAAGFAAELGLGGGVVQTTIKDLAIRVSQVAGAEAGAAEPLVSFDSVALEGGSLDLAQRSLAVRQLKFTGGASRIVRDKNGSLRIVEAFGAADRGKSPADAQTASTQAPEKSQPWRIALDALDVENLRLVLADHSFGQAVAYDVENLRAGLKNIRNDGKTPIKFEAALRLKQGGAAQFVGDVSQDGSRLTARASLERIDLKPLQPMLASRTLLSLASGEVSANVKVDYRATKGRAELRAAGPASIDNLLLNEAGSGERMLAWKTMATGNLNLSLAPDRLTIDEVRIAGLGATIVIFKDRSVNLAKALAPSEAVAGADAKAREAAAKPAPAATADAEPVFPIVVDLVRIEKGAVDFADLSLVLPFGAKVQDLEGMVSGISTDRASRASVKLEGRVDEYGLARAEGSLNTFNPKIFTDISVIFRNVEMPALSPYSATFAGRKIASGKLALDLHYKIENSVLAGETKVVLEKFTLGERVEAPNALNLPLDLAIALLTDADGKLDLTVPIRGNVDNPQFSYGHLIGQALANLITRIVTAPFRALGALFGGSSAENFDSIVFDPGRATLLPPEQEKLKQVAAALGKRPQLKLAVQGGHGAKDREALQQRGLRLAVAEKLGRKPLPGQEPAAVSLGDAGTQRALEQIFLERSPESALAAFVAEVEKLRGKPVDRVSPVFALVGRASADSAFYAALLKRLEQSVTVADAALKQLADARAKSVIDSLAGIHAVPAARLEQRPAAAAGGDAPPQAKLILDVARGG